MLKVFMNSTVFWDIKPCSLYSHLATCFHAGILLDLFNPEDGSDVFPKSSLTFNGLPGVTSRKILHFITTAVRTSGPTKFMNISKDGRYD
jgi:hypothetical protein